MVVQKNKIKRRETPPCVCARISRSAYLCLELLLLLLALGRGPRQLLGGELQVEDLVEQLVFLALPEQVEHDL